MISPVEVVKEFYPFQLSLLIFHFFSVALCCPAGFNTVHFLPLSLYILRHILLHRSAWRIPEKLPMPLNFHSAFLSFGRPVNSLITLPTLIQNISFKAFVMVQLFSMPCGFSDWNPLDMYELHICEALLKLWPGHIQPWSLPQKNYCCISYPASAASHHSVTCDIEQFLPLSGVIALEG